MPARQEPGQIGTVPGGGTVFLYGGPGGCVMPALPGTNGFEYELEIYHDSVTYSTETNDFSVEGQCLHEMANLQIPCLQFRISLNATTKGFKLVDGVYLKTRAIGEAAWLYRFVGDLKKSVAIDEDDALECMALGTEMMMKAQQIGHADFGNTYIEDQQQDVTMDGTILSSTLEVYCDLDTSLTLQTPLVKASINKGSPP